MRTGVLLMLIFCFQSVLSQKVVRKSLLETSASFIQIDANNCFNIEMTTADTNEIQVEAKIDGEYRKDLLLNIHKEGSGVVISSGFQPNFVNPNDKLSAHKVVSISLQIILPEQKNVQIFGTSCNVTISGIYKILNVTLSDGNCQLEQVSEMAGVRTQSGDIDVFSPSAEIVANSKYGTVKKDKIPFGDNKLILNSTTGNIHIRKMK